MSISVIEAIVIAKDNSDKDGATALLYLMKYGYLEPRQKGSSALLTQKGLDNYITGAVRDFQTFAGIESTGVLDPLTVELMGTPRCGVRDIIGPGATAKRRRKKRFLDQNILLLFSMTKNCFIDMCYKAANGSQKHLPTESPSTQGQGSRMLRWMIHWPPPSKCGQMSQILHLSEKQIQVYTSSSRYS